jgi:uncharacterized membrane protein
VASKNLAATRKGADGSLRSESAEDSENKRFLTAVLGAVILALWIVPLRGSLWIDELGTYWVIKDGIKATIHRATQIQGQTPAYYLIEWLTRTVGGRSELALRLPSLIAMSLAVYLLYRLTKRLADRETAIIAGIVFAAAEGIAFAADDARPYAIATLALIGATLFLVRWIDEGGLANGAGYVALAALTIYLHYLFGIALIAHSVFAYIRRDRLRLKGVALAAMGATALLLPAIPQLLELLGRRDILSVPSGVFGQELFETIAPPVLVGGILVGLLVARFTSPLSLATPRVATGSMALAAGWLLIAPTVLFAVSTFTSVHIFAGRYLITAAPGAAILAAVAIRSIGPARARRIVALAVVVCAALSFGSATHNNEDWRGAIATLNTLIQRPETPVLVHSALIEAAQLSWLNDPYKASYLMSPVAYYPMKGLAIPMPFFFDKEARGYLEGILPLLRSSHQFFLLTRYAFVESPIWIEGRLRADGFHSRIVGSFGVVTLYEFSQTAP